MVMDFWKGMNYWWFQMLVQQGYIVVSVDNWGIGVCGEKFKKMMYQQLGYYEMIDQIEAVRYLGSLFYVDENCIGIFGWSYGGYMFFLCVLKGNDVFKVGIVVVLVINWNWYDIIYIECYMWIYKENEFGYWDNLLVYFVDCLKGDYLLVYGMGDDNVYFQYIVEMVNVLIVVNKQFDIYFYLNWNYGIYGGNVCLYLYWKMMDFLEESLDLGKNMIVICLGQFFCKQKMLKVNLNIKVVFVEKMVFL